MGNRVPPDWAKLKVEYVSTGIQLKALAKKYGIPDGTVRGRSTAEKWGAARTQYQADLSEQAISSALPGRVELLARFNAADLEVCRGLRQLIVNQMNNCHGDMEPAQIRALSGAAAEVQKIGRLALGAETESSIVTTRVLEPLSDAAFLG